MTNLKRNHLLSQADKLTGRPAAEIEQIVKGIRQRVPVEEYANKGYSAEQMKEIRLGMVKGISYKMYSAPYISPRAMREWRKALEKGVSDKFIIDYLCDDGKVYSAEQIKEIRLGLQNKQDIKLYANVDYSAEQMKQIRLGQKAGISADLYADLSYSAEQMKMLRIEMILVKIIDIIKTAFNNIYQGICDCLNKLATESGEMFEELSVEEKAAEYIRRAYERINEEHPEFAEKPLDHQVDDILSELDSKKIVWFKGKESSFEEEDEMEC